MSICLDQFTVRCSNCFSYCCSVLEGPVRDRAVPVPGQARRLLLGADPGHHHPGQAAEASQRGLRQLRREVSTSLERWCRCC